MTPGSLFFEASRIGFGRINILRCLKVNLEVSKYLLLRIYRESNDIHFYNEIIKFTLWILKDFSLHLWIRSLILLAVYAGLHKMSDGTAWNLHSATKIIICSNRMKLGLSIKFFLSALSRFMYNANVTYT